MRPFFRGKSFYQHVGWSDVDEVCLGRWGPNSQDAILETCSLAALGTIWGGGTNEASPWWPSASVWKKEVKATHTNAAGKNRTHIQIICHQHQQNLTNIAIITSLKYVWKVADKMLHEKQNNFRCLDSLDTINNKTISRYKDINISWQKCPFTRFPSYSLDHELLWCG